MEILYQYCGFTLDENLNIFCVIKKMLLFLPKKKKQPNPQEGWKTTHLSWKGCWMYKNKEPKKGQEDFKKVSNQSAKSQKSSCLQRLLVLGEKHFQFMYLVPLSLFIRKKFYFFPSQGNTSLGIEQWALHLVPVHLVLFYFANLCLKVSGTLLEVELSAFLCVLQNFLYSLEDTYPSCLFWIPLFSTEKFSLPFFSSENFPLKQM